MNIKNGFKMKRIIVIGPNGSGKSELSRKLGDILELPLYHLDNIWWKEDKTHISRDEFDSILSNILKEDEWIIDGDYSRTYETRIKACDTIILLDYPLDVCLNGVASRIGKERNDIPWVEKELDHGLVDSINSWFKEKRPMLLDLLNQYGNNKNILILKNRDESNTLVKMISK